MASGEPTPSGGPPDSADGRGAVMLLGVAVMAVSSSAVLVRWIDASPVALAFWRTLGGAVILAVPAWRSAERPTRRQWGRVTVAGVALGVHFSTWLASLEMTSVAASVALVSLAPLLIAVHLLLAGRAPPGRTWAAATLAFLGVLVITGGDVGGTDRSALAGDGLAIVGAVAMAVYLTMGNQLRAGMSTAAYAGRTYAVAAISLLPVVVMFAMFSTSASTDPVDDGVADHLWAYDTTTWPAIGAMILGPQLAGHTSLNLLLKRLGSVTVSMALLAEPIGAGVLVWLFFDEVPPLTAVLGTPIILAGLALQLLSARPTDEDVRGAAAARRGNGRWPRPR